MAGQEPSAPYSRTFCVCQFTPFVRRRSVSDEAEDTEEDTEKVRLLTRRYTNCTALRLDIYPMVRSGCMISTVGWATKKKRQVETTESTVCCGSTGRISPASLAAAMVLTRI